MSDLLKTPNSASFCLTAPHGQEKIQHSQAACSDSLPCSGESNRPSWPRYFWKVSRYTSHFYCHTLATYQDTAPIYIIKHLQNIRGRGRWHSLTLRPLHRQGCKNGFVHPRRKRNRVGDWSRADISARATKWSHCTGDTVHEHWGLPGFLCAEWPPISPPKPVRLSLAGKLNLRIGTGWRAFFRIFRPRW